MASIRHFPATHPLPDWRNLGVMLRALLGINLLAALGALMSAPALADWPARCLEAAALVEPALLLTLALLYLVRDLLRRLPVRLGQASVLLLAGGVTGGLALVAVDFYWLFGHAVSRMVVLAMLMSACLLGYFELRARVFSPAQTEARLAALNARIRPHFLFNSLNAVLSLIRARPQQAEAALESLSDLFRAAMGDPAARVTVADEVALSRQYLELEHLRLGERLTVDWQIDPDSLCQEIPPLMLQPLLENAVYHGIEPRPEGGVVSVRITADRDQLQLAIANPLGAGPVGHAPGNQMALANIRERLALYYDLEARLEIDQDDQHYEVRIYLPCHRKPY
ncbi:histidine kinase [Dechloromonas sp. ZS-1]|uniref:sensor histidine kinase n=1 Tax=Dechloromonas sp. ZS-1 TaxID=3138067 RepID=UPI0031FC0186